MNKLFVKIIPVLFLSFFMLSIPRPVHADIVLPEYVNAKCNPNEILVDCDTGQRFYPSSTFQNLTAINTCKQYENNPKARFIAASKGSAKYCYREVSLAGISVYHLRNLVTLIITTIIFELAIFYLFGLRSKKVWLAIILVNILSVSLFYFANIFLLPASPITTLIGELFVVFFEFIILKIILTEFSFLRIFISTLIANITSATAGSLILMLVKSYLKA